MKRQVRDSGSKTGLRLRFKLHLAVTVGEVGEHEEGQPVRRLFIEGTEHARRIRIAGAPLKQSVGFVAAFAAEIFVQEIDHRPEVTALLDIDLEQVAHVVKRRRRLAEVSLLLDRRRLGVALDDDEAAQQGAIFARHFLPGLFALVGAERHLAVLDLRRQQDAPAIFRHPDVVELGPALGIDGNRRAQINQRLLETFRPHVVPPADIAGMPFLQRALDAGIVVEPDIVRDQAVVIDIDDVHGFTLPLGPPTGCHCRACPGNP